MNNKSAHKDYCENYNGSLANLATDIGAMTHEARAELFNCLADYVKKQYISDSSMGRIKYAEKLEEISNLLIAIKELEDDAWRICKSKTQVISIDDKNIN